MTCSDMVSERPANPSPVRASAWAVRRKLDHRRPAMATTSPAVPAKLEGDLASFANNASARWVDASGKERTLTRVRLEYRPYLVGTEGADRDDVPLGNVIAIDVDRVGGCENPWSQTEFWHRRCSHYPLVVAHWRRAPWGELIRLRPE